MGYEHRQDADIMLDVALGRNDMQAVHHIGRALGVQLTDTDIWDLADTVPTQQVWLAPTQASIHNLTSTSGLDTAGGAGARTVRVWGLTAWDQAESYEDVAMAGVVAAPTASAYVIIHRMLVVSSGASGPNVGNISATAVTDGTITAHMLATIGSTRMAVIGVPSTKFFLMTNIYAGALRTGVGANADISLLVNTTPETQPAVFCERGTLTVALSGASTVVKEFKPPATFQGPCIVKVHAAASIADTDVVAGFDGVIAPI